jgi:hypothetical protein
MVVEIKIVVVVVLGMMVGSGGYFLAEPSADGPQIEDKAPQSSVTPVMGYSEYYIVPNSRYNSVPMDDGPMASDGAVRNALGNEADLASDDVGFEVHWAGSDGARGSGIAYYDVEVRINDGEWMLWKSETTSLGGMYYPDQDGNYYFRCRAVDKAGNAEQFPDEPQAQFIVHGFDVRGHAGDFELEPPYVPWDPVVPYPYRPCPPGLYCANGEDQ